MNSIEKQKNNKGAALLLFVIFFLIASSLLVYGIAQGAYKDLVQYKTLLSSKEVFFAVEAGVEDAIHRHRNNKQYSSTESFTIGSVDVDVSRAVVTDHFELDLVGVNNNITRKTYLEFTIGSGASFSYGLQSDTGGILMDNSSSVQGNIYSNGSVVGNGGGPSGNDVFGTVISAGAGGYVEGIHATGSVYANSIVDSVIDKNAHCDSIDQSDVTLDLYCDSVTATSVGGSTYAAPASDQPTTTLPITDAMIDDYKLDAEAGEIIESTSSRCSGGVFTIDSSTTTGPAKIECDVFVDKNSTVWSLAGPIWIEGSLEVKSNPTIEIDPSEPSLVGKSIQLIVDDPVDRVTGSQVVFQAGGTFVGSGDESYIVLISQNEDEELGGSEVAINSKTSVGGDLLLYASHGEILIEQSGNYVGVAAKLIHLQNTTKIIYQTGAISLQFPDGPGGGYVIGEWREVE